MTNKEICFKYQNIENKAIEIAVLNSRYVWIDTNVKVSEDGLRVVFSDEAGIVAECLITWEDLND